MRYVLLVFLWIAATTQAASITAEADRETVRLNESFQLVFEASGAVDDDPDFSPLEQDFDILSRSQSSNISIINGDYKKTTRWSLTLMPREIGVITIPSIAFGKDQSPQLRMTIRPAGSAGSGNSDRLALEVDASSERAWVQGQVLVTVKLLSSESISRYGINELQFEGVDAQVEKLGDDKQYRAYRGGKAHLVLERRYALFPQQAGTLHIKPTLAEVELSSAGSNFFDPFNRRGQIRRLRARALDIQVQDRPETAKAGTWLPAAEIQLVEEWPDAKDGKPAFRVGEPVTRILSLLADGLTSAQLPELAPAPVTGIKQYPDQPTLRDNKKPDGVIGVREERIALIPTQPGNYTLPAIEIPWWNTGTGKMETARIPARQIRVGPGTPGSSTANHMDAADPRPREQTAAPGERPENSTAPVIDRDVAATAPLFWKWLSLAFGVAWLLTLASWWFSHRRHQAVHSATSDRPVPSTTKTLKALSDACRTGNARACHQALLDWGRCYYNQPALSNLDELGRRAGDPLQSAIEQLESCLYSNRPGDWDGARIAEICRSMSRQAPSTTASTGDELEPLFK